MKTSVWNHTYHEYVSNDKYNIPMMCLCECLILIILVTESSEQ